MGKATKSKKNRKERSQKSDPHISRNSELDANARSLISDLASLGNQLLYILCLISNK
jgi:hypothetical protein